MKIRVGVNGEMEGDVWGLAFVALARVSVVERVTFRVGGGSVVDSFVRVRP